MTTVDGVDQGDVVLNQFPEMTSDLLVRLTEGPGQGQGAGQDMKGMDMKETR